MLRLPVDGGGGAEPVQRPQRLLLQLPDAGMTRLAGSAQRDKESGLDFVMFHQWGKA